MTTERVPDDQIEALVGVPRDRELHYGRAVSSEGRVYILHSEECLARHADLRDCKFSQALARGILQNPPAGVEGWVEDVPLRLRIVGHFLWPYTPPEERHDVSIPVARVTPRLEER